MIDHVMRSRDGMKIHVVELFDPLRIEYCTFWFYSVVEKARHLFITQSRLFEVVIGGGVVGGVEVGIRRVERIVIGESR
jgi:hypothetical protein